MYRDMLKSKPDQGYRWLGGFSGRTGLRWSQRATAKPLYAAEADKIRAV